MISAALSAGRALRTTDKNKAALVIALGGVAGAVALAYEVLWTRELLNLLGSTTQASATVLAAFMAGLALGAWVGGRLTTRISRPLWLYVAAEGALAVVGLIFPWLPGPLDAVTEGRVGATLVLGAALVLPAGLMGIALPALSATLQAYGATEPRFTARLYAVNAFGGAAAALFVGFGALPVLGLLAAERGTALIGISVAVLAALIAAKDSRELPASADQKPGIGHHRTRVRHTLLLAALFLGGVAALGYEVLWARILVLVMGSSTNAFIMMIGLYVSGVALGSLIVGFYLDRVLQPARILQYLQLGIAVTALAGAALFGQLPSLALSGYALLGTTPVTGVVVNVAMAGLIIMPPTIFIGASLPVAVRLMERGVPQRGRELGMALAVVTAGNVAGVFLVAFGLIPWVGLQHGVAVLALLNLAAALLIFGIGQRPRLRPSWALATISLVILVAVPLLPRWDRAMMASGVFRHAPIYLSLLGSGERLERAFAAYRTRYYREGSEALVAVFDRPTLEGAAHRVLTIDGKVDASTGADMATQVLSGHVPFLFRPSARTALVIGLASGVTVGALAEHDLEALRVVEIEPAVLDAARWFDEASGAPLDDARVRVSIADGRRYLRTRRERYDIIVSEPSNPWLSMSARLFTQEFFEQVLGRLTPDGVLVQWVPLYGLSTSQFEALLRTLLNVFPHVAFLKSAQADLVAVASVRPLSIPPGALQRLHESGPRWSLAGVGLRSPAELLARWVADGEGARMVLGPGALNTDDNGLLELGSPWYLLEDTAPANRTVIDRAGVASRFAEDIVDSLLARADGERLLRDLVNLQLADSRPALARAVAKALRDRRRVVLADLLAGEVAASQRDWGEAARLWQRHDSPEFKVRRARLAYQRAELEESARRFAETPAKERSADDDLLYALSLVAVNRDREAIEVLQSLRETDPSSVGILALQVKSEVLERMGRLKDAASARHELRMQLDGLRRCLEADGCRDVLDTLVSWSASAHPGTRESTREALRQALYLRILRPIPLYLSGVSQLWLGERAAARVCLTTYRKLLPEPDAASRVHALLESLGSESDESTACHSTR